MTVSKDLEGTFVLDTTARPWTIDLKVKELDLSELGSPVKIPATTVPSICKLDGNRLRICFPPGSDGKRPTAFAATGQNILLELVRAPLGFKDFPQEVTLKATDLQGTPAGAATVTSFMSLRENAKKKGAPREWTSYPALQTGADGTLRRKYADLGGRALIVRDKEKRQMGIVYPSPASLLGGELSVPLKPECRVSGTLMCEQLKKAGKPIGWTNVYLMHEGRRLAMCDSSEGKFEFLVPPGRYQLNAYGEDVMGKVVTLSVPPGRKEFTADPIVLPASKLALLVGRPAPELEGVLAWKGQAVKLADLKGKYVLLEFWGYWCGPCVHAMPVLIELHEKYADRGLAIVGVHIDGGGDVETVAQLDKKIAGFRKKLWKGKDLPFPVALTARKVGGGRQRRWSGRWASTE